LFNSTITGQTTFADRSDVPFEVRDYEGQRAVFVDGLLFDFIMEEESLKEAKRFCGDDPLLKKAVHGDIKKAFLDGMSEFLGREVTLKQVNDAIVNGTI